MNIKIPLGRSEFILKLIWGRSRKKYVNWYVKTAMMFRKKIKHYVIGYTNRCEDGRYVLFLDYDKIQLSWLLTELKHLIHDHSLGDVYIFESSPKSFHVVCLDKFKLDEFLNIARSSSVDEQYIYVPLKYGKKVWTLRLTEKDAGDIKFVKMIKGNNKRQQSNAHANILKKLFKLNIKLKHPDKLDKLIYCKYPY